MSDRCNIRVTILIFLRIILAVISAGALACHIAQIVLISRDGTVTSTQSWWPDYNVYTLYYAGTGLSLLSSVLLVLATCARQTVWGDRFLSVINAGFLVAIVVYSTLKAGVVPWIGQEGQGVDAQKGFATSCSAYSGLSTVTFQRCWLQNGTWLGLIILAGLWIFLALFVLILHSSSIYPTEDFTPVLTTAAFAMPADLHRPQSPVHYTSSESPMMSYAHKTSSTGTHTPPPVGAYDPAYQHRQGYISHANYFNIPSSPSYQPYNPAYNNVSPDHGPSSAAYPYTDGYQQYNHSNTIYEEKTAISVSPSPHQSVSQPPHLHEEAELK